MNKVIVRITGGLGNQMFCYAAARRLAWVNNAELVIDDKTGFKRDKEFKRKYMLDNFNINSRKATYFEKMEPFERYRRGWAKFVSSKKSFYNRKYIEQEVRNYDSRLLEYKIKGSVYLDGLWLNEGYFKDIENIIRNDLQIKLPRDELNRKMFEKVISCNAVAIHVRWFDKPNYKDSKNNIRKDYYQKAIKIIMDKLQKPYFFIFSNDPKSAMQILNIPSEIVNVVDHNKDENSACYDLWLMRHCKHFITVNSTFSWWGAWLSESRTKIVIAPSVKLYGVASWIFEELIPDDWVTI